MPVSSRPPTHPSSYPVQRTIPSRFAKSFAPPKQNEQGVLAESQAALQAQVDCLAEELRRKEKGLQAAVAEAGELRTTQRRACEEAAQSLAMEREAFDRATAAESALETVRAQLALEAERAKGLTISNAELVGHKNSKQKIQQHLKLKEDINTLQEANLALKHELVCMQQQARSPSATNLTSPTISFSLCVPQGNWTSSSTDENAQRVLRKERPSGEAVAADVSETLTSSENPSVYEEKRIRDLSASSPQPAMPLSPWRLTTGNST